MENNRTTLVSVATGIYFDYWSQMVRSWHLSNNGSGDFRFVVFTDRTSEIDHLAQEFSGCEVYGLEVKQTGWPDSTQGRYRLYADNASEIVAGSRTIIHIDADMLARKVVRPPQLTAKTPVAMVQHPGYFRPPTGRSLWSLWISRPEIFLRDVIRYFSLGGVGAWEINQSSSAFIPRSRRRYYVCGGFWISRADFFYRLVSEMADSIERDSNKGIVAVWHDESHLNRWVIDNHESVLLLGPEWCHDPKAGFFADESPLIEAVDKGNARIRE